MHHRTVRLRLSCGVMLPNNPLKTFPFRPPHNVNNVSNNELINAENQITGRVRHSELALYFFGFNFGFLVLPELCLREPLWLLSVKTNLHGCVTVFFSCLPLNQHVAVSQHHSHSRRFPFFIINPSHPEFLS